MNKLYFGDNLDVLREKVKEESVDLVYLDPPFNSDANYNVLFHAGGQASQAQAEAFRDTWEWLQPASDAYDDLMRSTLIVRPIKLLAGPQTLRGLTILHVAINTNSNGGPHGDSVRVGTERKRKGPTEELTAA